MSESNSPYSFGGPESVGKPFAAIGSLFSTMGKSGKRNQAFNDTVNLHRQMEQISTEEHGKREQITTEEQSKRQAAAAQTASGMVKELQGRTERYKFESTPEGGLKMETSGIKAPKTSTNSRPKSSSKPPGMVAKTPSNAPVQGDTAKKRTTKTASKPAAGKAK